jgi:catechol 2,3-dioxygenase-like lactoylglutathione lyase family enzyme
MNVMTELKIDKFDQIGIVVKDIEKAAKLYEHLFDFKNKLNIVEQSSTAIYQGNEVSFKMKKIMQSFGGKQFEIIELVESTGNHLYKEFVDEGNSGLHHLGLYTKNAPKIIEYFKEVFNIDVIQTGFFGKVNFCYLNTKSTLGFYFELISF